MSYRPVYNPKQYKRSNRYLAGGRLRPLAEQLLSNQFRTLVVRWTNRRPLGWTGRWRPYYRDTIYRNRNQRRRRQELIDALSAFRRARKRATPEY